MDGVCFKNINTVEYVFIFYRVIKGTHVVLFIKHLGMRKSALHTFDRKQKKNSTTFENRDNGRVKNIFEY